jgi:hypothetical protein
MIDYHVIELTAGNLIFVVVTVCFVRVGVGEIIANFF